MSYAVLYVAAVSLPATEAVHIDRHHLDQIVTEPSLPGRHHAMARRVDLGRETGAVAGKLPDLVNKRGGAKLLIARTARTVASSTILSKHLGAALGCNGIRITAAEADDIFRDFGDLCLVEDFVGAET